LDLKPGDSLFFHKDDRFFGNLHLNVAGNKKQPIVFTSYGSGKQPIFTGAKKLQKPTLNKKGNTVIKTEEIPQHLFINGRLQTIARFPNKGWLVMDGGDEKSLKDDELEDYMIDAHGATARMRLKNWEYQYMKIESANNRVLVFDSVLNIYSDERDVRPAKVKMKVSNCFRTFEGAEIYARIASFVSTARKHDKNVFTELCNTFSGYNFLTR